MLQLRKNEAITGVIKDQVKIRMMEMDWYTSNYGTITGQAAMLAGFAFSQLTTEIPKNHPPSFITEWWYMVLTSTVIGLELTTIIVCTYLSVWGPGLALRGTHGAADMHKAVDVLRNYQPLVFCSFVSGWLAYFVSAIFQVWIYYRHSVARVVAIPLFLFLLLLLYYTIYLTAVMRVNQENIVEGKIDAVEQYELVGDLDRGIYYPETATLHPGSDSYCPIIHPPEAEYEARYTRMRNR
eukprot:GEMP01070554.1.p1 GENE.GEMP01070554.1~~GEMP01070554.1.p1  ORF type:complete len:252 (+),score=32.57 GEMP01070554.1:40-756(+)